MNLSQGVFLKNFSRKVSVLFPLYKINDDEGKGRHAIRERCRNDGKPKLERETTGNPEERKETQKEEFLGKKENGVVEG